MSPRSVSFAASAGDRAATPSKQRILHRNRLEYDDAADAYWRLTVYEAVHGGWWFANIGGQQVLDVVGNHASLGPGRAALEIGSGLGDTCRYLALRYGCETIGVEINPRQVRRARIRLIAQSPQLFRQVRFVRADVLQWRPHRRFEAAFGVDSLMLLEDRRAALRRVGAALAPGASLVVADVLAGPRIAPALRRFMWKEDGILNLPTLAEQVAMLEAIGFVDLNHTDLTSFAAACFERVEAATLKWKSRLIRAKGRARYDRWLRSARLYRQWFGERAITYSLVVSRWKP
jgi:sarcosine/dimethylglycine N-methyltransferase